MVTLLSAFTRPRTLSTSSSTSSSSSSSAASTKSCSEGNLVLTSADTNNTIPHQHVLLRTQFQRHASASNATAGVRSEKRSRLADRSSSTSSVRRGSMGSRKREITKPKVSGSADGRLAVPKQEIIQLDSPRTRTLTLAMSKFSLNDDGDRGNAEQSNQAQVSRREEAETQSRLKWSKDQASSSATHSETTKAQSRKKRREPDSPSEDSRSTGIKTPRNPSIVIIGPTPVSTVIPRTKRPIHHGRSLSLDIPDLLQYRSRKSPTPSTPSPPTSALSSPSLSATDRSCYQFPPSPIPSFPPFTPRQPSPELPDDSVRIFQPTSQPVNEIPHLTPSDPAYFIVPSTCDKRRRTISSAPLHPSLNRPIKKRKQAVNGALVSMFESPDSDAGRPQLEALMPTAIDVVDFIKTKGGMCHEGDVFFRFRTAENEHVRNVVSMILDEFAISLLGPDRRRWVRLRRGVALSPRPL